MPLHHRHQVTGPKSVETRLPGQTCPGYDALKVREQRRLLEVELAVLFD